jgi:hypothetical protein
MIVRSAGNGIHLITQPDHARLAARIMERCTPLLAHPRRDSILRAVRDHDDGWAEGDATPSVHPGTGEVVDFITAPVEVRQGVWPRSVAALEDDPVAAALVAQHALVAYDRMRPDPAWAAFFVGLAALRDAWLARTTITLEELQADYVFVRLGDLISLAFCTGNAALPAPGGWRVESGGYTVVVSPDGFDGPVPLEVEARALSARRFGSNGALRAAIAAAPAVLLRGELTSRPWPGRLLVR